MAESIIGLFKIEVIRRRGPWRGLDDVVPALVAGGHQVTGTSRSQQGVGTIAKLGAIRVTMNAPDEETVTVDRGHRTGA